MSDATGGEGLERVFWNDVKAGKWDEVERALASNYTEVTPLGTLDRNAAIAQFKQWQLKNFSLGDVKTELNDTTLVVTYTITFEGNVDSVAGAGSGTGSAQPTSNPQHMMTIWQQQKTGWVAIAHSAS